MHFDFTVSLGSILVAVVQGPIGILLWRLNRLVNVQKDFPPHRHINGKILYPRDFAPGKAQAVGDGD